MPRPKSKGKSIKLFCRGCKFKLYSRRNQTFKATSYTHPSSKIVSPGLNQHLTRHNAICLEYYQDNDLCLPNGHIDFSTSQTSYPQPPKEKQIHFTSSQMGLTMTSRTMPDNTTTNCSPNINSTLNNQVLYNAFQPQIDRNLIESNLQQSSPASDDNQQCTFLESDDSSSILSTNSVNTTPPPSKPNQSHVIVTTKVLVPPTPQLCAEIELINIMLKEKMSLSSYNKLFQWAQTNQSKKNFDFASVPKARSRDKILSDIRTCLDLPNTDFQTHILEWLPDKKATQVFVRPFMMALNSLLTNPEIITEDNLSFPSPDSPFLPSNFSIDDNVEISELHHGDWWIKSWEASCKNGSSEILVPVIFYMDGISLDAHGRLSLTPLNMTLGILNTATRKRPDAWETIYFHPDSEFESSHHSKKTTPIDNIQNLHNGIELALQSFKEICELSEGVQWDDLPYGGKKWKVHMKFAIAYVIGDTELHDKLCGRYGSRGFGVKTLCRHCNCPTPLSVNPYHQQSTSLWLPSDFDPTFPAEWFKKCSHHPIKNAFDSLDFGIMNPHKIHLATPGECLHMHQLGIAKRAVESFNDFVMGRLIDPESKIRGPRAAAFNTIGNLSQKYGAMLSRQSDRDFPRTKFSSSILSPTKKQGSDYAGILLCVVIAMLCGSGKDILCNNVHITAYLINQQVYTLELILGMEEFLKHGRLTKAQLPSFHKTIIHFLNQINSNCQRAKGMSTVLIKNHLYFHLVKYIEMWGPPAGFDSAPSESNHKTEIKAPSKNTQQNASSLIAQTAKRQIEYRTFQRATQLFNMSKTTAPSKKNPSIHGAKFNIQHDEDGKPIMLWEDSRNKNKPPHPQQVLDFCCQNVLPLVHGLQVRGFTEHYRVGEDDGTQYIFRSHPSYRSDSGQTSSIWYDFAMFQIEDNKEIPAQILCFLDLSNLKNLESTVQTYSINSRGAYAVVRRFESEPKRVLNSTSTIVLQGKLMKELYLFACDSITSEVAVVQNLTTPPTDDQFFVIENRNSWLQSFCTKIESIGNKTFTELYAPSKADCSSSEEDDSSDSVGDSDHSNHSSTTPMDCRQSLDEENPTDDSSCSSGISDD